MIKLMIVDDEQWVLDGLRCQLDWKALNIEIVCEALNGQDARAKIQIYQPDIVLTDINMPLMDGLQLTEFIAQNIANCVVIVMSGYADFHYAQQAMKFGVSDFILKPVDRTELSNALQKSMRALSDQRALCDLRKQTNYSQEDLKKWTALKTGKILPDSGRMFAVKFEEPITTEIRDYMERCLSNRCNCFLSAQEEEKCFVGICTREKSENVPEMVRFLKHLMSGIHISGNCVISSSLASGNDFDNQMQHLGLILESISGIEHGSVILEDEFNAKRMLNSIPYVKVEQLVRAVEDTDETAAKGCLAELEPFIRDSLNYELSLMLQRLLSGLDAVLQRYGMRIERLFSDNITIVSKLGTGMSRAKILLVLEDGIHRSISYVKSMLSSEGCAVVQRVKEYIDIHYAEPIGLNDLAARFYIAPTYLSRQFKQAAGINLNRYIRQVRMHHAAVLMLNSDLKIADISARVGYDNPDYFMTIFREEYHMTPTNYRIMVKGKIVE